MYLALNFGYANITTHFKINSVYVRRVFYIFFSTNFQYSLLSKQEFAHDESIWCVAWGRTKISDDKSDVEMENDGNHSRDKGTDEFNDFIVTGSLDDTVKIWDVKDSYLELKEQLTGHSLGVVSVAVSSDGERIASSSLDSGLCIWKKEEKEDDHDNKPRKFRLMNQAALGPVDLWTVAFSPDDKYVISGSHEGKISLYDVETAKPEQVLDPQNGKFTLSIAYVSRVFFIFFSSQNTIGIAKYSRISPLFLRFVWNFYF